jgi:hypothetical protein
MMTSGPLGDFLLDAAADRCPIIRDNLRSFGDKPVADLLSSLTAAERPALQSAEDFRTVAEAHAAKYYGREIAGQMADDLRSDLVISTANHFGVDTFAVSVQGTQLLALRPRADGSLPRTVVALACSVISMDNITFPLGMLLYDLGEGTAPALPQRLAVFPSRMRSRTVGSVVPFDERMIEQAHARLSELRSGRRISAFCECAARRLLDEELAAPETLALPTYGHQGCRVNGRLWERTLGGAAPRLVQLSLESVCSALLANDMDDVNSLAFRLFFRSDIRTAALLALDGMPTCWRLADLNRKINGAGHSSFGDGTVLFWGMGDGRRFPLTIDDPDRAVPHLAGVDGRGRRREWELTPRAIGAGLSSGELVPSLFTCFSVLALARGIGCVGGLRQARYLPSMQRGVVRAVADPDRRAARLVAGARTGLCLPDMHFLMRMLPDGRGIPAGPVEIAGAGGLSPAAVNRIPSVIVREAYLAAFPEVFPAMAPDVSLPEHWIETLAAENATGCRTVIRLDAA